MSVLSISGHPLSAEKLVRFAYVDEAGTSRNDPHAVVGGILIHADDVLLPIQRHMDELVKKHIPEPDRDGFVFHMTEIFSGTRYFKDREMWPWERRAAILDDLVKIPEIFESPMVFGFVEKAEFADMHPQLRADQKKLDLYANAIAFLACTAIIEHTVRTCWPDEVVQVVAEDNPHARSTIRQGHSFVRDRNGLQEASIKYNVFPLERIQGGILFSDKPECRPLQLADMCAFFVRGHLRGNERAEPYYQRLKKWLAVLPTGEVSPWNE
jgi:hypothetical protein